MYQNNSALDRDHTCDADLLAFFMVTNLLLVAGELPLTTRSTGVEVCGGEHRGHSYPPRHTFQPSELASCLKL